MKSKMSEDCSLHRNGIKNIKAHYRKHQSCNWFGVTSSCHPGVPAPHESILDPINESSRTMRAEADLNDFILSKPCPTLQKFERCSDSTKPTPTEIILDPRPERWGTLAQDPQVQPILVAVGSLHAAPSQTSDAAHPYNMSKDICCNIAVTWSISMISI